MLDFVFFSPPQSIYSEILHSKKLQTVFWARASVCQKASFFLMYYNGNLTCRQFVYISFKIVVLLYYQKNSDFISLMTCVLYVRSVTTWKTSKRFEREMGPHSAPKFEKWSSLLQGKVAHNPKLGLGTF